MLTLYQATLYARERCGKNPAKTTLKSACQSGLLPAKKLSTAATKHVWTVLESDLDLYLASWQPGRGAKPGNKRRVGKVQSEETRQKISKSLAGRKRPVKE